jgi:hypothetical protein
MTLTASGGIIGIVVGWLLSLTIRTFVPSLALHGPAVVCRRGFPGCHKHCLFFGMWPALKAGRLDPSRPCATNEESMKRTLRRHLQARRQKT